MNRVERRIVTIKIMRTCGIVLDRVKCNESVPAAERALTNWAEVNKYNLKLLRWAWDK